MAHRYIYTFLSATPAMKWCQGPRGTMAYTKDVSQSPHLNSTLLAKARLTRYSATVNVSLLVPGGPEPKGTGKKSYKKREGSEKAEHRMQ